MLNEQQQRREREHNEHASAIDGEYAKVQPKLASIDQQEKAERANLEKAHEADIAKRAKELASAIETTTQGLAKALAKNKQELKDFLKNTLNIDIDVDHLQESLDNASWFVKMGLKGATGAIELFEGKTEGLTTAANEAISKLKAEHADTIKHLEEQFK